MDVQLPEDLGRVQQVSVVDDLLDVPGQERGVQDQWQPVSVDEEEERQKSVYGSFGDDVGVQAVAEVDGVDVVTATQGTLSAAISSRGEFGVPRGEGRRQQTLSSRGRSLGASCDVPFQIAVHDGEEDLQEEVYGIYEHRKQV